MNALQRARAGQRLTRETGKCHTSKKGLFHVLNTFVHMINHLSDDIIRIKSLVVVNCLPKSTQNTADEQKIVTVACFLRGVTGCL